MDPGGERVSFLTRRRALRLSESVRAALQRAPVADDHGRHERTQAVGLDPVRILLFGSGPLIGYGVTRRRDAVDGALAELLAGALHRGVTVESRVRLGLPLPGAVASLGGAGTATFSAAVFSPRFGEELAHGRAARTRSAVRGMLRRFREESDVPLVVCLLPMPQGSEWRSVLRRPRVERFNRILEEEAAAVACTTAVASGTYWPTRSDSIDAAWYRALAERLLPALVAALSDSSHRGAAAR